MNLHNVCIQILFIFILFTSALSIPTTTPSSYDKNDNLKSNFQSNLIETTNENRIDDQSTKDSNTSSNVHHSIEHQLKNNDDQLNSYSIKKNIDSVKSTGDEHQQLFVKLNTLDNHRTCNETIEYKCKSTGECIDRSLLCDNFKDCPEGDDEQNCDQDCNQHNKFKCKSDGKCIDLIFKCNSFPDCSDGSDEDDCKDLS